MIFTEIVEDQQCTKSTFGKLPDGQEVYEYTLSNENGLSVSILNYGGIIRSIKVPDRNGEISDILLGHENLAEYLTDKYYLGALIGRYANRIGPGTHKLDDHIQQLDRNEGQNTLHGGSCGFNKVLWQSQIVQSDGHPTSLKLSHLSPDGDQGFPGNLEISVNYSLNDLNELSIIFEAVTDATTVISLTLHPYFNLAGQGSGSILDHELQLHADRFLPIDKTLIPTGEYRPVNNTPMDFRNTRPIKTRIGESYNQLALACGYDHNWLISNWDGSLKEVAQVCDPDSGRQLTLYATTPGLQFYSGNFLGESGNPIEYRSGFCLEPQFFPDSPNQGKFPTTVLRAGEKYEHQFKYRFGVSSI